MRRPGRVATGRRSPYPPPSRWRSSESRTTRPRRRRRQHDDEDRDQVARLGEPPPVREALPQRSPRVSSGSPASRRCGGSRAARPLRAPRCGLLERASPRRGPRPPRSTPCARRRAPAPSPPTRAGGGCPALGEGEQGEDGEAEKRGQTGESADFLDQIEQVAARGYSSETTVAASPPGAVIISTTRSARLASSPAITRCSREFRVRLDPIGVERRLADRAPDPLAPPSAARSRRCRTAPRAASPRAAAG